MKDVNEFVFRVTGDEGGESFLVVGSQKSAIVDAGMAYCASALIKNIEKILGDKPLDYVLATHSHYDHIGGIANLKEHWPNLKVLGGEHATGILSRPNARKLIRDLSVNAQDFFDKQHKYPPLSYNDDLMMIDQALKEGDIVDLGDITVMALETPGHTKCSMSYFLREPKLLFASESSGVVMETGELFPAYVTSYADAIEAIRKGRECNPDYLVIPHTPRVIAMKDYPTFFDDAQREAIAFKDYVLDGHKKGMNNEDIAKAFVEEKTEILEANGQPKEAFTINIIAAVKYVVRDFCEV